MHKFHVKLFLFLLLSIPLVTVAQRSSKTTLQVKPLPALPPQDPALFKLVNSFTELKGVPAGIVDWFYWTNYSRQRPRAFWDSVIVPILNVYPQINTSYAQSLKKELYQSQGYPLIKPNSTLLKVAQGHAVDLARNTPGSISHSSTDGTPFERRVFKSGIQNCAAENLSLGPFNTVLSLIFLYIDEGLPGVGHRKNLMNPYYTEMGIGLAATKGNAMVVVQDFACDQGKGK